jgi:hypothetical protein
MKIMAKEALALNKLFWLSMVYEEDIASFSLISSKLLKSNNTL